MEHKSVLIYTTDDDGIHLECKKDGWGVSLGFEPTVEDVNEAWEGHYKGGV